MKGLILPFAALLLSFSTVSNAVSMAYDFAAEGNVHEAGYTTFDTDMHGNNSPGHSPTDGLPGGLKITASDGAGGYYYPYMDGHWKADAGLGVCKSLTNSCGSDDNQMSGEYIHMEFGYVVDVLSLDIIGDHVPVTDNAIFNYSLDKGSSWAQINFGTGNSLIETLMITGVDKTFDYHIQGGQMYLSAMTVSPVPIPTAFWLFGTALIGFVGLSRRTSLS